MRREEATSIFSKRNYKDSIFRMIFSEKEDLLDLYNAVNGTRHTNVDDLEIRTLENATYMNVKNDVSFIFSFQFHLYEHQTSVNPNMPLRDLIYIADLLKGLAADDNIYGSKKILLPEPRFVVFYNGIEELPDESVCKLSDLYERPAADPALELAVRVLNINLSHNQKVVNSCQKLKEYAVFVDKVRDNLHSMDRDQAVDEAVKECIAKGVLKDFLLRNRAEVVSMWLYEYDQEKHIAMERRDAFEDGRNAVKKDIATRLRDRGESEENIADILGVSQVEVSKLFEEHAITRA